MSNPITSGKLIQDTLDEDFTGRTNDFMNSIDTNTDIKVLD